MGLEERNIMKTTKAIISSYCMSASLILACAFPLGAEAKTLYVNIATGNDSITYANNGANSPWQTIGRAAWGSTNRSSPNTSQAARAGDTVLIAAGTYSTTGSDSRFDPVYNPANSGTPGNPITFQASGTVTLRLSSSRGSVIGANQRNYIIWKGFTIYEANAPSHADTGSVTWFEATHSSVEDCVLDGNGDPGYGDNHPGVRIENSRFITVRNNRISNYRTSVVNGANGNGVQVYDSYDLLIANNDISTSGSGINFKSLVFNSTGTSIIRNNLIHEIVGAGIILSRQVAGQITHVHNNIVRNSSEGIRLWRFDASIFPQNNTITNNVLYGNVTGLNIQYAPEPNAGNRFLNNIVANNTNAISSIDVRPSDMALGRLSSQHNLYYQFNIHSNISGNYTLATWKSSLEQDTISPEAISANPLFVDAANGNFRLQSGSPALSLGIDILDLNNNGSVVDTIPAGAYITGNEVIGLSSQSSDITPPTPPSDLRIQ